MVVVKDAHLNPVVGMKVDTADVHVIVDGVHGLLQPLPLWHWFRGVLVVDLIVQDVLAVRFVVAQFLK